MDLSTLKCHFMFWFRLIIEHYIINQADLPAHKCNFTLFRNLYFIKLEVLWLSFVVEQRRPTNQFISKEFPGTFSRDFPIFFKILHLYI